MGTGSRNSTLTLKGQGKLVHKGNKVEPLGRREGRSSEDIRRIQAKCKIGQIKHL